MRVEPLTSLKLIVASLMLVSLVPAGFGWALISGYASVPAVRARVEREVRPVSGSLGFVQGIAVSESGSVFAADRGARQLIVFPNGSNSDARLLAPQPGLALIAPQSVALGPDRLAYLLDRDSGVVGTYDADGKLGRLFKAGGAGTMAIALDSMGRLYSADGGGGMVRRMLPTGDADPAWGVSGPGQTRVGPVVGLALVDDVVYATTQKEIVRLDDGGRISLSRPLIGNGGPLARGPGGTLLMSDMTMDAPGQRWQTFRVWLLDREGRTIGRIVGPDGRDNLFNQPRGVATGPLDRIYVANGNRVTVYRPNTVWVSP